MVNNQQIKSNIWKYYLATALAQFAFFTPIIQLFYLSYGLTILKIAILGVIWSLTRIILEIPSSIFADKCGRKKTLIIACIFAILQVVVLLLATDYWIFMLASIFSASAYAFFSGTNIAFFYDTLKVIKKEHEFEKLWARQSIYGQIPLIVAFISSGFLFRLSPLLPFQISLVFLVLSFIITLTLKEPPYHKPLEQINVFLHFKQSIDYIFNNQHLKAVLIFTLLYCLASDFSYGYGQIYLNNLDLPLFLFGIVYTFKSIFCTISANFAPYLRKKYSYQFIFALEIILAAILLYVMVWTNNYVIGAICFVLFAIPQGLFAISKSGYMHQHIESHYRATIDSMFSFLVALMFIIVEPIAGYLADLYSIKLPFLIIAIILTIYCFYFLVYGRKRF